MSPEILEINLFVHPHDEDASRWSVIISASEQASPDIRILQDPFDEEEWSDCRRYVDEFVCKSPYSVTRARKFADSLQKYAESLLNQLGLVELVKDDFAGHSTGNRSVMISINEDEGANNLVHQLHWELLEDPSLWDTGVLVTVKRTVSSEENDSRAVVHEVPKFRPLLAEALEINLFAHPDCEDVSRWSVAIFPSEHASPGIRILQNPFDETQRSECRWYVQDFVCKSPYSITRARNAAEALQKYAESLLSQLGLVELVKDNLESHSHGNRSVVISINEDEGANNSVHQLYWELLEDPSLWDTEVQVTVKRISEENCRKTPVRDVELDGDQNSALPRVNGLLVVARDLSQDSNGYDDVSPHLALGILAQIQEDLRRSETGACLHLEVVRPGSLQALEKHLERTTEIHGKRYYHFAHFDVHGSVHSKDESKGGPKEGYLLFNKPDPDGHTTGGESAQTVAKILGEHGVTVAVLNACESARANSGGAANIAKTFTRNGIQNVLAMSFRISSSAVELLLRAFYHSLFLEGHTFSHAARQARAVLRSHPMRKARLGLQRSLADNFVPVVYSCGQDSRFTPASRKSISRGVDASDFVLRTAQFAGKDEKQLIGRDFDLLRLEKKLIAQGRVHLIGRAGVGKSALLRHASSIWQQTSFVDIVLFVDFAKVSSLTDAIGSLVSQIPLPMEQCITLKVQLQDMITSPTFDSTVFAEVLLKVCSKPRVMVILDGLHAFYPTCYYSMPNRPSEGAVPMITRFMEALINLGDAVTPHDAIYHILVSRGDPLEKVQEDLKQNRFGLRSLRLSDSIELGQLALRDAGLNVDDWLDADLNELELLVGLLDGNPSAILHILPQMSQTSLPIREFRSLVQHGILPKSSAQATDMTEEIDSLFQVLGDESRALLLLLSTFWHEGLASKSLLDWTISHKVCTNVRGTILRYVQGRGLIDVEPGVSPLDDEVDDVATWIHPLLTICGRRTAYEMLESLSSALESQSSPKQSKAAAAAAVVLSTLGVQLDERILREETGILCAPFKRWFFQSVATYDMQRAFVTHVAGFGYKELYANWSLAAGNLATCLSICTRKPYLPIDQWPLDYFQSHAARIRIVGSPAQMSEFAESFEQLFEIFIDLNGSHAIPLQYQRYALVTVTCLTSIYNADLKVPVKHKKYVDMAHRIVTESEERFGEFVSATRYLKGLTLRHKAEYLLRYGPQEQAVEVWNTMLKVDESIFENPHPLGIQLSPEQVQELVNVLSTPEENSEAVAKRLSALSSNTMLEAYYKSRKNSINLIRACVSAAEGDPLQPKQLNRTLLRLGNGMENIHKAADAMGFRGINQVTRWWPENFDMKRFWSKFDSQEVNLAGLERAISEGNAADASRHLHILFMKALEKLDLDDVEEFINALMRYSEHVSSRGGHSLDCEKLKEIFTGFKRIMGIVIGYSTKAVDGISERDLAADETEKQIRMLKEANAPSESIEALEISREIWLKESNPLPTTDNRKRSLDNWRNSMKLLIRSLGDQEFRQKLPTLHLQFQQHMQRLQDAEQKEDFDLALEQLEVFEEFLRQPDNKIFAETFEIDWCSKRRLDYQYSQVVPPVADAISSALAQGDYRKARFIIRTFENDVLSPELRQHKSGAIENLKALTKEIALGNLDD